MLLYMPGYDDLRCMSCMA